MLGLAAFMLPAGALGDRYGRKRILLAAFLVRPVVAGLRLRGRVN
ncbi:hypothetical protein [Nocardia lijiangensis]|nr:hypothetical protein [Nocardia lijiangensis]